MHVFRFLKIKTALLVYLSFVIVGLYGCEPFQPQEQEALKAAPQNLTILMVEHPLIYQKDSHGQVWGIEAELLKTWADAYHFKIEIETYKSKEALEEAFQKGRGHIAAARLPASLSQDPAATPDHYLGPTLGEMQLHLYCLKKLRIQNAQSLSNLRVAIQKTDLSDELQHQLEYQNQNLKLDILFQQSAKEALVRVAKKESHCAIVDELEGDWAAQTYLMLEKVGPVADPVPYSWWVRSDHPELASLAQIWFQKASRSNDLRKIIDRYMTQLEVLDEHDIRYFYKNLRDVFPTYKKTFLEASRQYHIPWSMLAAVAYQESHWQAEAESYTGVKGLMQITLETAAHIGLSNREDPFESIFGGARYLKYLYKMFPKDLDTKERWALTLAAYNIGIAHLKDAQELAQKQNLNPLSWRDLKQVLPQLADPDVYPETTYGFARGYETVKYVDRTFSFYRLLYSTRTETAALFNSH